MAQQSIISGTVLDPKRQPVSEARVYFTDGPVPLPEVAVLTDSDGKFSLSAPVAGTYQIQCSADGYASVTVTVKITKGQDAKIEILLGK